MELKLSHIAPYLPYALKCEILNYKNDYVGKRYSFVNGFYLIADNPFFTYIGGGTGKGFGEIRFFLKPISELDTEDLLCHLFGKRSDAIDAWIDYFNSDSQNKDNAILCAPYPVIEYCLLFHYDIYNLIPKGLAIDINTL